jgi:hypothetical protein
MPLVKPVRIAAFGALNEDSYAMFAERLGQAARGRSIEVNLTSAGPYPNAAAVSAPGRPLRAEALQDGKKKQDLLTAVAVDARGAGAESADILCMPCMSMIGFHDEIEAALGRPVFSLAKALAEKYKDADKVGVIHMRPAKKRIEEIFGAKAVTPDDAQAARLLAAEEEAKTKKSAAPVEAVMKEIAESWKARGLRQILFARADAPLSEKGPARIPGVGIESHFGILAEAIVASCAA